MPKALRLRPGQPADTPALREIYLHARRRTFAWLDTDAFAPEDYDAAVAGETIWVALWDDRPVGFVSWWPAEHFVHNLFARPDCQGCGIGSALLQACLTRVGRPAALKCAQRNRRALDFYLARDWYIAAAGRGRGIGEDYYLLLFEGDARHASDH